MSISTRLETITPAKARKMLQNMASNRPLSEKWVKELATRIKAGEWKINGETIKQNDLEKWEDGQHRLEAVVLADCPIETFVTRGLPSNNGVFDTIDDGKKRTIAHMFARHNEKSYALLAGAIRWLYLYNIGKITSFESPRKSEAIQLLTANPELRSSTTIGSKLQKLLRPSLACCLHYLCSRSNKEKADRFFDLLESGENISKSSNQTGAIYLLRERLLANNKQKAKLPGVEVFAIVAKAWNAYSKGKTIKALRWLASEEFPTIE